MQKFHQLVVVHNRRVELDNLTRLRFGVEEVALRTQHGAHRSDEFLADGVERRIRDLREQLGEVVVQQFRAIGEHCKRRVGAHRTKRLLAVPGHGRDEQFKLLVGIAKDLLALNQRELILPQRLRRLDIVDVEHVLIEPLLIGLGRCQPLLDLLVPYDPALNGVDQEHLPRLKAAFLDDLFLWDINDTDFGCHDSQIVIGDPVAGRTQAVSIEDGADHTPVSESD